MEMRQKFDIGDIVEYNNLKGLVLECKQIAKRKADVEREFHVDEYRCRVHFFGSDDPQWIRAKWLKHISRISQ
tara:strand:+ start:47 stop:265 length:219 start_codon:yes stop_codon:yes gene_type:complete